ncbi:AAA family ATPase [Micromonospora sp. WMMD1082]|uniref:helix-turn-helix transcriptional regulator n=1 Tax=Micromonospora sp. WMMD1082 TaxID=3016104 RepID=UPI0024159C6D|nr:AAA family ATPase [Micromonospora sp. WMMD1082]MDG4794578.1 AAA family ATPase [Micromonospora sp. WMMD1082]
MLVERDFEIALLKDSLAGCLAGYGGTFVASGPVGSGKTELLQHVIEAAREAESHVLTAVASRAEQSHPLGVVRQLLDSIALPSPEAEAGHRLVHAVTPTYDEHDQLGSQSIAPVLAGLTGILLEAARSTPIVICVDDAHFADPESLQLLVYLARRVDRARVLVVVAETLSVRQTRPALWHELLSQPQCRQVLLGLLSPQGVAAMMAAEPDLPASCRPELWQEATAGNPTLVQALIDEQRAARETDTAVVPGPTFARTALRCFYRSDETLLPVARAIAVLDSAGRPNLLAELLPMTAVAVAWAVEAATEAGLLTAGTFRHERVRAAILDAMDPQEHADLQARVATLLYRNGAPALRVARHALAASNDGTRWPASLMHQAAEQALEENDTAFALDCLHLAEQAVPDGSEQSDIQATLLRARWRVDPLVAERNVSHLLVEARAEQLDTHQALDLVHHLAWYGRPAEASEVIDRVSASAGADEEIAHALYSTRSRFAFIYPGLLEPVAEGVRTPQVGTSVMNERKLRVRAARMLDSLLTKGITEEAVADAESILQQSRLDEHCWEPIVAALEAMVFADCLEKSGHWCDVMLRQAKERQAPTWCALLSSIRASISYRQGNLAEAEQYAQASLSQFRPKALGIYIGAPLSVLILTATRSGRYDEAYRHLKTPVPDAMFQTPFGLFYLRARGRFQLAMRNQRAAIEDFETCRDLMQGWGIDLPGLIPWRTDLAQARLGLDLPAHELVTEQLRMLGPLNRRTRGISLRVLATTSEPRQRLAILRDAVGVLQTAGDQLELAEALTDLSNLQHARGEYMKARITGRRAQELSTQCWPQAAIEGGGDKDTEGSPPTPDESVIFDLSDAERRVAALAAQGYTNRQIARELFVTVSTVEQHLTRVYRKLRIDRRSHLPFSLLSGVTDLRNTA